MLGLSNMIEKVNISKVGSTSFTLSILPTENYFTFLCSMLISSLLAKTYLYSANTLKISEETCVYFSLRYVGKAE